MDIPVLQAFLAVAETGSFSKGAERIFITQPAVSKRIAALESELGTPLFDRIGREIQLTDAGRALQGRAHRIILEVSDTKRAILNLSGEISGRLRMAASHHIGLHRLPLPLQEFHRNNPDVSLEMRFMDSEGACAAVEHGDIELAVVTLPESSSGKLESIPIWDDPLEIVVGANHPLAEQKDASPIVLLNYPAILPGPGTYTREIILAALSSIRDGVDIAMSFQIGSRVLVVVWWRVLVVNGREAARRRSGAPVGRRRWDWSAGSSGHRRGCAGRLRRPRASSRGARLRSWPSPDRRRRRQR